MDVIIGGSPCQDLSVAGKRAGLAGERSGLFMEQIRLIKEMRDADRKRGRTGVFVRPRYMVWENVPGAFSSNWGADFKAVLEETIRIAEPGAPDVPLPEKGKWPMADAWFGDGWSIAYRVLDAQFWGVPQRRRRIALVADFGGQSAPEICFIREGLSWDSEPGGTTWEETAGGAGNGAKGASGAINGWEAQSKRIFNPDGVCATLNSGTTEGMNIVPSVMCGNPWDSQSERVYYGDGAWHSLASNDSGGQSRDAVYCIQGNTIDRNAKQNGLGISEDIAHTLDSVDRHAVVAGFSFGQSEKARSIRWQEEVSSTLRDGEGGNQKPCVYDARGNGDGKTVCTLTGDHQDRVTDYTAIVCGFKGFGDYQETETGKSLLRSDDVTTGDLVVAAVDCRNGTESAEVNGTLQAKENGGYSLNCQNTIRQGSVVRRLTPLECERLQGYPDGWTDIGEWTDSKGKRHKEADSPRYRALGNSIALPPWKWILKRISAQYERDATMASLFDGIDGFPLIWEQINGKGSAVWASEIEEFPIAVTKLHFPE